VRFGRLCLICDRHTDSLLLIVRNAEDDNQSTSANIRFRIFSFHQLPNQTKHPSRLSSYFSSFFSESIGFSMFYQNLSPEVVRRGNGMEYYSNGFCGGINEEKTLKVTLLGYKVMEEKTKFTVRSSCSFHSIVINALYINLLLLII